MSEILALLQNLAPLFCPVLLHHLGHVIYGMLISNGRMTMLEISRWTEPGGSYRTIQRLYHTPLEWLKIHWLFFTHQLHQEGHEYLVVGDEVVVSKADTATHGLGRFFSSLQNQVIPGFAFFSFSLVDVTEGQAYPIHCAQIVKEPPTSVAAAERLA